MFDFLKSGPVRKDKPQDYTEDDLKRLMDEATQKGAVHCVFHLDAHGPDAERVRAILTDYLAKLAAEKGVLYSKGEVQPAQSDDGKVHSATASTELLFETVVYAHLYALKYGPTAIEVLGPGKLTINANFLQNVLVDASESTQRYSAYIMEKVLDPEAKKLHQEHLKRRAELAQKAIQAGQPAAPASGDAPLALTEQK
jgi:hypothetical protein